MKLLHTADWHLGKRLDHISRLKEQVEVLEEICQIADQEEVDAVLLAGDIFDHINPSIEATELLYKTLKRLSSNGKRAVIGIAGNHDSPNRIEAPDPLARECGIILTGYPDSIVKPFELESGLAVVQSAAGFIEMKLPSCDQPLRVLLTPYANEVRLRTYLGTTDTESTQREILASSWQALAEEYCDVNGVNILLTHLFVLSKGNPKPEEPEDEKPILTIGGAQEIYTDNLPANIHYVALGHLHQYQEVSVEPYPVIYSGSPLAYSMSEADQAKFVVILEKTVETQLTYRKLALTSGKPLARKRFHEIEEAIAWLEAHPHTLVELTLISDTFLNSNDRKRIHQAHDGILTIIPKITDDTLVNTSKAGIDLSQSMEDLFRDYFKMRQGGQEASNELMELFREVLATESDE